MTNIEDLIRQSSPGDSRFYQALMNNYYNFIYRLTYTILNDTCEGDDAAQETIIRAYNHLGTYQVGTNIKSWLARIAINICRDKLRRMKTRKRLQEVLKLFSWQAAQEAPSPEEVIIRNERSKTILSLVEELDEKHRLPILLRYVQNMSIAEIAQTLDLKEGTVLSRLHYAHLKLRNRLVMFTQDQKSIMEGLE